MPNAGNPILWTDCRLTDLGTPPSKSVTVEIKWFGDSVEVRGVPGMLSKGGYSAEASPVILKGLVWTSQNCLMTT